MDAIKNYHEKIYDHNGHWDGEIWCGKENGWLEEDGKCSVCGEYVEEFIDPPEPPDYD